MKIVIIELKMKMMKMINIMKYDFMKMKIEIYKINEWRMKIIINEINEIERIELWNKKK